MKNFRDLLLNSNVSQSIEPINEFSKPSAKDLKTIEMNKDKKVGDFAVDSDGKKTKAKVMLISIVSDTSKMLITGEEMKDSYEVKTYGTSYTSTEVLSKISIGLLKENFRI